MSQLGLEIRSCGAMSSESARFRDEMRSCGAMCSDAPFEAFDWVRVTL